MFSITFYIILLNLIIPCWLTEHDNLPVFSNNVSISYDSLYTVNSTDNSYQDTQSNEGVITPQKQEPLLQTEQCKIIDNVDALLEALERADEDLRDFTASIKYVKEDVLIGDTQERRGKIYFYVKPETEDSKKIRQFAVHFESLMLGERKTEEIKDFIFDGRYLVERLPDQHQFFKREVVRAGEEFDPLSIDGPFPLPIGQKKSELLKRFEAKLLTADVEGRLAGFYHMLLTVRDQSDNDELEKIDLWYDPANLLPAKAIIIEKTGDINTVELAKIELNAGLVADLFSTETPDPAEGWKIEISRLENRNDK